MTQETQSSFNAIKIDYLNVFYSFVKESRRKLSDLYEIENAKEIKDAIEIFDVVLKEIPEELAEIQASGDAK